MGDIKKSKFKKESFYFKFIFKENTIGKVHSLYPYRTVYKNFPPFKIPTILWPNSFSIDAYEEKLLKSTRCNFPLT
jgi:hypothetical protein